MKPTFYDYGERNAQRRVDIHYLNVGNTNVSRADLIDDATIAISAMTRPF